LGAVYCIEPPRCRSWRRTCSLARDPYEKGLAPSAKIIRNGNVIRTDDLLASDRLRRYAPALLQNMRIAFLTPAPPSESAGGAGLAAYLYRMTRALLDNGHEPEVFIPSNGPSETDIYNGIPIHRVSVKQNQPIFRFLTSASKKLIRSNTWRSLADWISQARALALALESRHAVAPFQLVQSTDYLGAGLWVQKVPGRVNAVRCTTAADLYDQASGIRGIYEICAGYLENLTIRRADVRYAPSRFAADHFRRKYNIDVRVVRPPAYFDTLSLPSPSVSLPDRFFLHFGQLMQVKGTALLAEALPIAWERAPDLTMVWSGYYLDGSWRGEGIAPGSSRKLKEWRSRWGERANQIHITEPLDRPEMYAVLKRADAAVLPSQADNLPNTVIESLVFGIPVLGSRGASIDELVEEGRTGHLVALGDVQGLAEALVKMWFKQTEVSKGFKWDSAVYEEMQPRRAVANLVGLAEDAMRNVAAN
jgi:glycogen synthase